MAGIFPVNDSGLGRVGRSFKNCIGWRRREHESGLLHVRLATSQCNRLAFATGILGGTGNIAFFRALVLGGKASIVSPVTALFPLVTVILAVTLLHERIGSAQKIGLGLALIAIYLLSM